MTKVERANPTPSAWATDIAEEPLPPPRRVRPASMRWAAIVAIAACLGLIAWTALRTPDHMAEVVEPSSEKIGARATPPPAHRSAPSVDVETVERHKVAHADASASTTDDALLAVQATGSDGLDGEDPVGDEPHLVRARQLCNEGHALRMRGRLGLAEAKYLQALGLFPQYPRAMAGVVRVHLTRGDGAEAVRWAERLIAMQPNRSNNQLLLGDAYALSGKGHDARRHWRKSAAFDNSTARKRLKDDGPVLAKPTR